MDMGTKIRHLRVDQKLTTEALAEKADTNKATISETERGLNNNISLPIIIRIADVLGVSIDWLVDDSQGYPPPDRVVEKKRERSKR